MKVNTCRTNLNFQSFSHLDDKITSNQDKETVCDYEHDIIMYIEILKLCHLHFL